MTRLADRGLEAKSRANPAARSRASWNRAGISFKEHPARNSNEGRSDKWLPVRYLAAARYEMVKTGRERIEGDVLHEIELITEDESMRADLKKAEVMKSAMLLDAAIVKGDVKAVAKLLSTCGPLAVGNDGWTVLMRAACHGNTEIVQLLLPVSDPLAQEGYGQTALMLAVLFGNMETVQLLLPVSNPLAEDGCGQTALMLAALHGHADSLQVLLPVSDPRATRNHGTTALMLAAINGLTDTSQLLLPVSDCDAVNGDGKTAWELARDGGHDSVAEMIRGHALAQCERQILCSAVESSGKTRASARSI